MHLAATDFHEDIVQLLTGYQDIVTTRAKYDVTHLREAAENTQDFALDCTLEYVGDIEATDSHDHTLWHATTGNGNTLAVKMLLDRGLDIKAAGESRKTR